MTDPAGRLVEFGIFVIGAACIVFIFRVLHRYQTKRRDDEAKRQLLVEENSPATRERRRRELEEEHHRIRLDARERARLAFPVLLDDDEARAVALARNPNEDEIIREARELLVEQPSLATPEQRKKLEIEGHFNAALQLAFEDEMADLDFGLPTRVIDCGDAGAIYLYTQGQALGAGKKVGTAALAEERTEAAEVARVIIVRYQEKQRVEQASIASVTTRLKDLPSKDSNVVAERVISRK